MPFLPDQPSFDAASRPPPPLALHGVTILVVEDSRFASDALRLMCQRSGARFRRAEGLVIARSHLRTFRPDLVLVDMGLPDGRGEDLIAEIGHTAIVLGMSGDPGTRPAALAAGAKGFLNKPFPSLATFQRAILGHLPGTTDRNTDPTDLPPADPLALHDDLATIAAALRLDPDAAQRAYLARFLTGIAGQTRDATLRAAAATLATDAPLAPLAQLIEDRLNASASGV